MGSHFNKSSNLPHFELFCAFKLDSPNLDQKCKTSLGDLSFNGLIGLDRSNLITFQNPVYLHRFFVVLKCAKRSLLNCSTLISVCTLTGSRYGPCHSLVWWDHRVQPLVDLAIGTGLYKLLSVFANLYIPHMPKFHKQTFGISRTIKTPSICIHFVWPPKWDGHWKAPTSFASEVQVAR